MKAADAIVKFLECQGVKYVFGYQGGMITHLVDALSRSSYIKFVPCYHEQSAAFAAEGYARATGNLGVCITTSGPGATNTLTSVANAYFDSVPVLYITGQVNTYEYKYGKSIRQQGFQETDIVSMATPVVKASCLADNPSRLMSDLERLVSVALSGRKGPVLLDLPMNIQRADILDSEVRTVLAQPAERSLPVQKIVLITKIFSAAEKPLVICGGGLSDPTIKRISCEFLKRSGFPYVVSLMGKGLVDETSPMCLGMIGSYGNRCANIALAKSDVVLVLGSRLDLRQTGNRESDILKKIKFIRIDLDPNEIMENPLPNQLVVEGNCRGLLEDAEFVRLTCVRTGWIRELERFKRDYSQQRDIDCFVENRLPYDVVDRIGAIATNLDDFVVDIGQNQMWAAQMLRPNGKQAFLTSGGMAPMGYAIPAAVGMAFANPNRHIYCLCGDGGFHIAVQSLMLISQHKLPVTVVVFNNRALGMITQFQRLYFNSNLAATTYEGGYQVPNLEHLSEAYGLRYVKVTDALGFPAKLRGGELVEIRIPGLTTVVPKLEFNKSLDDMTPSVQRG